MVHYIKSCIGMPSGTSRSAPQPQPSRTQNSLGLPPLLRDEKPSEQIMKYMEGILKKQTKTQDWSIHFTTYTLFPRSC